MFLHNTSQSLQQYGEKHQENFCCKFLSYKKFLHLGHWPSKQESTDVKKSWSYNKVAYHGVLQKKSNDKTFQSLGPYGWTVIYCTQKNTLAFSFNTLLFTNFVTYIQDLFGFRPKGTRVKIGFWFLSCPQGFYSFLTISFDVKHHST